MWSGSEDLFSRNIIPYLPSFTSNVNTPLLELKFRLRQTRRKCSSVNSCHTTKSFVIAQYVLWIAFLFFFYFLSARVLESAFQIMVYYWVRFFLSEYGFFWGPSLLQAWDQRFPDSRAWGHARWCPRALFSGRMAHAPNSRLAPGRTGSSHWRHEQSWHKRGFPTECCWFAGSLLKWCWELIKDCYSKL